ncbi:hypothetical protein CALCODRAFT_514981 [Calocera cornea HHB12733]|uniref:P-loop containing nucleoside triphosphate hydrolase protein n=1 Tax=Calocera cornea HHB12733 TaxID=1353952 RepID=A0A165IVP7_9BASI|nr:hypothetical protein CALCODRAFT_514981 [Calocera cornea HHB12733]
MGDTPPVPGQRNADISHSLYALHTRQLFDVIDEIRDIGGQLNLDLPRIVVIGNQSAGKSSLIEAIARINVPRGSGTCTRCPTEVRLRYSTEPWKCVISLRYEYDESGAQTGDSVIVPFGNNILDPTQVEVMLRRAQLAILNDDHNPTTYLGLDYTQLQAAKTIKQFSKNVVCVEVSGSLLTDLTFVDLPGIIQHHPTDRSLVHLIKSMVQEYISDSSSLILCTITMKDDPENQAALSEAKAADPDGKRTIGVLTKPDTLQPDEEDQWVAVLKNEGRHRLNLGYYITKQPAQAEVQQGIDFDAARQNEVLFFETVQIWQSLSSAIRQNVGTPKLTAGLSQLLSDQIRKSLPGIFHKIHDSLDEVNKALESLGSGPSPNPIAHTIDLCNQFASILNRYTQGHDGHEGLVQGNNHAFGIFKKAIRGTAPLFLPFTKPEVPWNNGYSEPTSILEDGAGSESGKTYDLEMVRKNINDAKTRELPFNVPYAVKIRMMLLPIKQWKELVDVCFGTIHPKVGSIIDLILGNVFGRYTETPLFGRVREILNQQLAGRVAETQTALKLLFDMEMQGPYTQNLHYFSATREKLIAHYRDARRKRETCGPPSLPAFPAEPIRSNGPVETNGPVSMPPESFEERGAEPEYTSYLYSRPTSAASMRPYSPPPLRVATPPQPPPPPRNVIINNIISNLALLGYHGVHASHFYRISLEDEWEEEIIVMAETRAYFQIAYKRIIDTIPQAIDFIFIRPLADTVQHDLISGLQFDSPDAHERCRAYLAESPQKAMRRQRLIADRERLKKAREALKAIGFSQ